MEKAQRPSQLAEDKDVEESSHFSKSSVKDQD